MNRDIYITKVSVVLTVYNGEKYIYECLNSIINQTLIDIEIICIDDFSKDDTLHILKQYQAKDKRVKILQNNSNLGAGASRNKGLDMAEGEYVIFLDADDIFEKDMLEKAYNKAKNYEADICIFKEDLFCDNKQDSNTNFYFSKQLEYLGNMEYFSPMDIKDVVFNLWNGWAWDKIFCLKFVKTTGVRFQEMRTTNDAFFVHSLMICASKIVFLNEILVHHRTNVPHSLSNTRDKSWECCYLYLQELRNYIVAHGKYEDYKKSFINWSCDFLYWNYWTLNENNRKKLYHILKEYIIKEFEFFQYQKSYFYNTFYYWFICEIYNSRDYCSCKVAVDANRKWVQMLEYNEKKMDSIFQYLEKNQYNAAIWGVSERGKVFVNKYKNINRIKGFYDRDIEMKGIEIEKKYIVKNFTYETCKGIDFIFVTNKNYFSSAVHTVKRINSSILVFNLENFLEPYLSYPLSLEECIL